MPFLYIIMQSFPLGIERKFIVRNAKPLKIYTKWSLPINNTNYAEYFT